MAITSSLFAGVFLFGGLSCTFCLSAQTVSHPLAVGKDVSAPVFLPESRVVPPRQAPIQHGVAVIALVVDQEGYVSRSSLLRSSGIQSVDLKALADVQAFRFKPAVRAGIPVAVAVTMSVPETVGFGESIRQPESLKQDPDVPLPKLLHQTDPVFPRGRPGCPTDTTVVVELIVDVQGVPRRLTIRNAAKVGDYDAEALRAVETYRFSPARKDGVPVEFPMPVQVKFICP